MKAEVVLSPKAFLKLKFMCLIGPTEVGGFGVTALDCFKGNSGTIYIDDFQLPQQENTAVFCKFTPEGIQDLGADLFMERGLQPSQYMRIWIHTHPGYSPHPSGPDEETFATTFGSKSHNCPPWAVMLIMAKDGSYYAKLRANPDDGPTVEEEIDVREDWSKYPAYVADPANTADQALWAEEYKSKVSEVRYTTTYTSGTAVNRNAAYSYSPQRHQRNFLADPVLDDEIAGAGQRPFGAPSARETVLTALDRWYYTNYPAMQSTFTAMVTDVHAPSSDPEVLTRHAEYQQAVRMVSAGLRNLKRVLRDYVPYAAAVRPVGAEHPPASPAAAATH